MWSTSSRAYWKRFLSNQLWKHHSLWLQPEKQTHRICFFSSGEASVPLCHTCQFPHWSLWLSKVTRGPSSLTCGFHSCSLSPNHCNYCSNTSLFVCLLEWRISVSASRWPVGGALPVGVWGGTLRLEAAADCRSRSGSHYCYLKHQPHHLDHSSVPPSLPPPRLALTSSHTEAATGGLLHRVICQPPYHTTPYIRCLKWIEPSRFYPLWSRLVLPCTHPNPPGPLARWEDEVSV